MTLYSVLGNSRSLVPTSTPRAHHGEMASESGTVSRKQSLVPDNQAPPEVDENSNVILSASQNNNDAPHHREEQEQPSDNFESLIFDSDGDKLNPEIERIVDKIYDWIQNEEKHRSYQVEDKNEKEDFFRWISEDERKKIINDILECFKGEGGYEILTDADVEGRYFAKNLDAIPLHLLLVHSTEDLLNSIEDVKRVPSAGEILYALEKETYPPEPLNTTESFEISTERKLFRSPSTSSELSVDATQSSHTNTSYANSSFGYQTECDFDELVNGLSGIELNYEDNLPEHEFSSYDDGEVLVELPQSFFDKL